MLLYTTPHSIEHFYRLQGSFHHFVCTLGYVYAGYVSDCLATKTTWFSQEVDHPEENNDNYKADSGVNNQTFSLLLFFFIGATENEELKHPKHEYQKPDADNKWDQDVISKYQNISEQVTYLSTISSEPLSSGSWGWH